MRTLLSLQCLCLAVIIVAAAPPAPPEGGYPEGFLSDACKTPKCPATASKDKPINLQYPLDCLQYVLCEGSEPRVVACPSDLFFSKATGTCEPREKANCVPCYQ